MPPIPFPFRLTLGVDLCSTHRIYSIIDKAAHSTTAPAQKGLARLLATILTFPEGRFFKERWPDEGQPHSMAEFLAGRYDHGRISSIVCALMFGWLAGQQKRLVAKLFLTRALENNSRGAS